ncbi:septal ring lytic transglycosylase RlpA family protein [Neolewinella litorea]|uniref:SPOR domain-containing protein n=1 Tax=Neolewinella litorea TaxID=2562452 RepID=A0A4S4NJQ3_9BACT|nr:RlpA-like double-psi beta-barrel domain-containing protein [Neolewinella litorea]THH40009.1 SPOR domain-containing protein [Neolewinella litorea]
MKRLLSLSLFITAASLGAQSFEWNEAPRPAAHPKEVQLDPQQYEQGVQEKQDGLAGVYDPSADGSTTAYGETYKAGEMTGSHAALPLGTLLRVTNTENGRSVVVRVTDRGRECEDCLITLSRVAADKLGIVDRSAVRLERNGFSNWNPQPPTNIAVAAPAPRKDAEPTGSGVIAPKSEVIAAAEKPAAPVVISREVQPQSIPAAPALAAAPETYNRYPVTPPAPTVAGAQQARGVDAAPNSAKAVVATTAGEQGDYAVQLAAYNNEAYALRRVNELKEQGLSDVYYRTFTKEDGQVINRVYTGTFQNVTEAQDAAKVIKDKYQLAGIVAKK